MWQLDFDQNFYNASFTDKAIFFNIYVKLKNLMCIRLPHSSTLCFQLFSYKIKRATQFFFRFFLSYNKAIKLTLTPSVKINITTWMKSWNKSSHSLLDILFPGTSFAFFSWQVVLIDRQIFRIYTTWEILSTDFIC